MAGKDCEIESIVCEDQNLVMWRWLETVMSLSAASNQRWEAYVQNEATAAADKAYLVPRLVKKFKEKNNKGRQKESHTKETAAKAHASDPSNLPTPGDQILQRYLRKISMDRDKLGQPPIVLDYDKKR